MREADREMPGHVVSIVEPGAGFVTCHSDAGFGSRAGQVRGEVKIQQFVSDWASVGGVGRSRGANIDDLRGSCTI